MWSGLLRRPAMPVNDTNTKSLTRPSEAVCNLCTSPSPLRDSSFCFWPVCFVILCHISSYFLALSSFLSFSPSGFNSLHFPSLLSSILSTYFFLFLSSIFIFILPSFRFCSLHFPSLLSSVSLTYFFLFLSSIFTSIFPSLRF